MLGYANFAEVSLVAKMAENPPQVAQFLRDMAARARPFAQRDVAELREFAKAELGLDTLESWDIALRLRKAAAEALFVLRAGGEAVLPRAQGAGRPVPCGRGSVRREHRARQRAGLAPGRALLPHRPQRRAGRPVLPRSVCARHQARRRMDGRGHRPASGWPGRAATGRLSRLQFLGPGGRQARPVHARRSDHPVPRSRTRPAPPADAGRRTRRFGHSRRRVGRGRIAVAVHGEFLLGMGRPAGDDGARRHRRTDAARPVRQDDRGEEFPERHADAAPGGILAVRSAAAFRFRSERRRDLPATAGRGDAAKSR